MFPLFVEEPMIWYYNYDETFTRGTFIVLLRGTKKGEPQLPRPRNYDDMGEGKYSRRGNSSSKIIFVVILISILICVTAVLIWVKILEAQEVASSGTPGTVAATTSNIQLQQSQQQPSSGTVAGTNAGTGPEGGSESVPNTDYSSVATIPTPSAIPTVGDNSSAQNGISDAQDTQDTQGAQIADASVIDNMGANIITTVGSNQSQDSEIPAQTRAQSLDSQGQTNISTSDSQISEPQIDLSIDSGLQALGATGFSSDDSASVVPETSESNSTLIEDLHSQGVADTLSEADASTSQNSAEVNEANESIVSGTISIDSSNQTQASTQTPTSTQTQASTQIPTSTQSAEQDPTITEQGVEMKKPLIAQNLSTSQEENYSRDIVKYQDYTIVEGDSLASIAQAFGISAQTIISVNQIRSTSDIWIGGTLSIPDRDGTLYIVKDGDTLQSITQQYALDISPKSLGDVNGLDQDTLTVGQKIFIPDMPQPDFTTTDTDGPIFIRPVDGTTIGMYNRKVANPLNNDSLQLDGILIQAASGTPVLAAESGTVVDKGFNENGSGFVKLMHANGYTTFYNYLGSIQVEPSDSVTRGQVIAITADSTSNYSPPVVFFRIEQGGVAFDPESFF